MFILLRSASLRGSHPYLRLPPALTRARQLHRSAVRKSLPDPRLKELGKVIEDEYAVIRNDYQTPKNPIILAHGLFGFDELHIAGPKLPGLRYWRGISDALRAKGIEVITATVPPSGSIEARAAKLAGVIEEKAKGKSVNIIAYGRGVLLGAYE